MIIINFEEALTNELATITDFDNKIFPLNATEGTKVPYLVYVSSEGIHEKTLDGFIINREVDCELHILHDRYFSLKDLTRQVISLLNTFPHRFIGGSTDVYVQDINYEKLPEMYLPELLQYVSVIDLTVRI